MTNRFLNILEAAVYLRMSRWYLYKLVERRLIPFIPMPHCEGEPPAGNRRRKQIVRFDIVALDQWMLKKAITPLDRMKIA